VFAIRRVSDGLFYTHRYPGSFNPMPRFQAYHSKSAASRQVNRLSDPCEIVLVEIEAPPWPS